MKPKTPAQEKLQNLLNQRYALEREIAKAKEECDAEYKRIFDRTGFPPDIPETASDWELYSTMKGSVACGKRLSSALKKELVRLRRRAGESGARAAARECYNRMYDLLHKERKYGAADTEGRVTLENAIERYCKLLGFSVEGVF